LPRDFFGQPEENSVVKTRIIRNYFGKWTRIVLPSALRFNEPIAYLDLYAGRGMYRTGEKSTPIFLLEDAVRDPVLAANLVTIFNDKNAELTADLSAAIRVIPNLSRLRYPPEIHTGEVDSAVTEALEKQHLPPTLLLADPFGYKGLTQALIHSVLQNWGCDCIFFFNFNRLNPALSNPRVERNIVELFGQERVELLRAVFVSRKPSPHERELLVLSAIREAMAEIGGKYTLSFRFDMPDRDRTSYYLIFVSKHHKGYFEMREIMAAESLETAERVPLFEYSADRQPTLIDENHSLDALEATLMREFSGQTVSSQDLTERHYCEPPFCKRNYLQALARLEDRRKIRVSTSGTRRAGLVPNRSDITFLAEPLL
jgi:three-Cys-motif partner protein